MGLGDLLAVVLIGAILIGPFVLSTWGFWHFTENAIAAVLFGIVVEVLAISAVKAVD